MTNTQPRVACDLRQLSPARREQHLADTRSLLAEVVELDETSRGYRLRLREREDTIQRLAAFIALDRRCCPFLRHAMVSAPAREGGGLWLELDGPAGAKAYLASEFADLLPAGITASTPRAEADERAAVNPPCCPARGRDRPR